MLPVSPSVWHRWPLFWRRHQLLPSTNIADSFQCDSSTLPALMAENNNLSPLTPPAVTDEYDNLLPPSASLLAPSPPLWRRWPLFYCRHQLLCDHDRDGGAGVGVVSRADRAAVSQTMWMERSTMPGPGSPATALHYKTCKHVASMAEHNNLQSLTPRLRRESTTICHRHWLRCWCPRQRYGVNGHYLPLTPASMTEYRYRPFAVATGVACARSLR